MKNNIKSERVRLEMTQRDLANELEVDESTIRRWENGDSDVPSSKATHMSMLFRCSIDYLFALTEERQGVVMT